MISHLLFGLSHAFNKKSPIYIYNSHIVRSLAAYSNYVTITYCVVHTLGLFNTKFKESNLHLSPDS